jgi:hypothetical protein
MILTPGIRMAEDTEHVTEADTLALPPEAIDTSGLAEIATAKMPSPKDIDISFFSHRTRKSTRLVGNLSDDHSIRARKEWLSFDFEEVIYITNITVFATGYEDYHEMEMSFVDNINGGTRSLVNRYNGESFSFDIKRFISGFGVCPTQPWFKSAKINRIQVQGIEQESFFDVINVMDNLAQEKDRIEKGLSAYLERAKTSHAETQKNQNKIEEQREKIEDENHRYEEISNKILEAQNRLDTIRKNIEISGSVEKTGNERVESINIDISSLNEKRRTISLNISEMEKQLRELQDNIHLFPTEIAGYIGQGTRNIRFYAALCAIPSLLIVIVTYKLFANSERMLSFFTSNGNIGIIDYLISRTPYVSVSAAVLAVCYTVLHRLISEIISINRRRQDLFKISIIATDVSYASQDGMNLTDEQRYNLRTQTKMEMLKEHLRLHLGKEYSYDPQIKYLEKLSAIPLKQPADNDAIATADKINKQEEGDGSRIVETSS